MSESSEFTALRDVLAERKRQDMKWGEQNHDPFLYLTILGEEYGETCQAALEAKFGKGTLDALRAEAVQTAAVALAIVECLDRRKWGWSKPHTECDKTKNYMSKDIEDMCDIGRLCAEVTCGNRSLQNAVDTISTIANGAIRRDMDARHCLPNPSDQRAATAGPSESRCSTAAETSK